LGVLSVPPGEPSEREVAMRPRTSHPSAVRYPQELLSSPREKARIDATPPPTTPVNPSAGTKSKNSKPASKAPCTANWPDLRTVFHDVGLSQRKPLRKQVIQDSSQAPRKPKERCAENLFWLARRMARLQPYRWLPQ
jgi:hypothetical protein